MGALPDNIFGSNHGSAVPGGNIAKPLTIALLALLAARYFGKGGQPKSAGAEPAPRVPDVAPASASDPSPGSILDGLGGLVKQFQQKGLGDTIDTWINPGANKDISSGQVSEALGPDMVDELSKRTGLSRNEVIGALAKMLPNVVDKLTPDGRLPTQQEMARLMG
jgi:uncharacterized protein YidB (DUF937 family)